jgi:GTP cyclohydrolase I
MKTDEKLGLEVQQFLIKHGVETPIKENGLSNQEKIEAIRDKFSDIMELLELDLSDDSLQDTPSRVAKMYVNEIFFGLDYKNFPKATTVDNKMNYDEMVIERNINVQSNCEHHFVIIDGGCHIGYIPKYKVLGLSKLNRIVQFFSKRPQIQERLTEQIYYALSYILDTENIAVIIEATHYCVKSRGIQDVNSDTVTSKMGGCYKKDPEARKEFLSIVSNHKK